MYMMSLDPLHAVEVICETDSPWIFLMLPLLIGYQLLDRDLVYVRTRDIE